MLLLDGNQTVPSILDIWITLRSMVIHRNQLLGSSFPGTASFDCRTRKAWYPLGKASALLGHSLWAAMLALAGSSMSRVEICLVVAGSYVPSAFCFGWNPFLVSVKIIAGFLHPCLAKIVLRVIFIILRFNYVCEVFICTWVQVSVEYRWGCLSPGAIITGSCGLPY